MIGGYSNGAIGSSLLVGFNYQFHETLLGTRQFAQQHRVVPNFSILEGSLGHTTFYYEFDYTNFADPGLIPAMDRTGETNSFGVTQAFYTMGKRGRVFVGYRYDAASTRGSDFDRRTHQANARIEHPLTEQLIVDGGVRYFWDDYPNPNSLDFFERPRSDQRMEFRAGVQYYFKRHLNLRTDYIYVDNDSNVANLFDVPLYAYSRHLLAFQVIFDF